jgi:hypothetical protein
VLKLGAEAVVKAMPGPVGLLGRDQYVGHEGADRVARRQQLRIELEVDHRITRSSSPNFSVALRWGPAGSTA